MKVNFVDLGKGGQYKDVDRESLTKSIEEIINNGSFVGGKYLQEFEDKFSKYTGSSCCVGVGSGTDALILALRALGVGNGHEVIVPANTFIATAFAVTHVGATPVFCDVSEYTYLIDIEKAESLVTTKTKAIIPVHLYGSPCDMEEVVRFADKYGLFIVEDCAQAAGADFEGQHVGTFGHAGAFSFYPTKNLGGLGQGGAVITDNTQLAEDIRNMSNMGRSSGSHHNFDYIGYNSRLDPINAVFLTHNLEFLDKWNDRRRLTALHYNAFLPEEVIKPMLFHDSRHVFHLYEAGCHDKETRDALYDFLIKNDIGVGLHYPVPCNLQSMYSGNAKPCPVAEKLSDTLISLPMHPSLTNDEVERVIYVVIKFFNSDKIEKHIDVNKEDV